MSKGAIAALMVGSGLVSSAAALAKDASEQGISEIVVTAQRAAESVQDVPIGISVIGAGQLERQQVNTLYDLSRTSASVQFSNVGSGGSGGGGAFIRGIGTNSLSRAAEGAVGIVVDGVVQGNTQTSNLFDLARVEVLRGPQGTLFGQSVSAGVINISTAAPDASGVSGKFETELSSDGFLGSEYGKQVLRGALNLPVGGDAALRVGAFGAWTQGVLRNTFLNKDDNLSEVGLRGRFKAGIGDAVTVNLSADYNKNKGRNGQFLTYIEAVAGAQATVLPACGVIARRGNLKHCSSTPEVQSGEAYGASGQIDADISDALTLTSITAYRGNTLRVTNDIDRMPATLYAGPNIRSGVRTEYRQFTQELRLASDPGQPLSFTMGAFYIRAKTNADQNPTEGSQVFLPTGAVNATIYSQHTVSTNLSGFGEVRFKTGAATLFAGGRINRSEIDYDETRQAFSPFQPTTVAGPLLSTDYGFNDTDFSWRIGGRYEPSQNLMVYATVSRGYKNAQLAPIQVLGPRLILERVVRPEVPQAYEIGVKSTMLDGRLAVNISAFHQRVKNLQTSTLTTLSDSPVPVLIPTNVSKVISKGFEADVFGKVGSYLTLNASASYNVAKYPADYFDGLGVSLKGRQIAYAPRFTATASAEYARPVSGDIDGFLSFDVLHRSETRMTDQRVASALAVDRSRWVFGGRVGARVDDRWSVALFARNLGASRIPISFLPLLGNMAASYAPNALRQVGVQAQIEF